MNDSDTRTHEPTHGMAAAFPTGSRLKCEQCGAEIEVIRPCTCQPPDQVLRCCGKEMSPAREAGREAGWGQDG
jgi:hypothetical protein